jgi:hypothetical protein
MQKRKTIRWYQANNLVDLNRNSIADGADIGWNAFVQYDGPTTAPYGSRAQS